MDSDELDSIYEQLRSMATDSGLAWIVDEVDEATAVGVVEVKTFRQQTRAGQTLYEEVAAADHAGPGRRRGEEFLTQRPLTRDEQVTALIDGLSRALLTIEDVAAAAVSQLSNLPRVEQSSNIEPSFSALKHEQERESAEYGPPIADIIFRADQGGLPSEVRAGGYIDRASERQQMQLILAELREEVR